MKRNKLSKLESEVLNIVWKPVIIDGESTNYEISDIGLIRNIVENKLINIISNRKSARECIYRVKRNYKDLLSCSTTIDQPLSSGQ